MPELWISDRREVFCIIPLHVKVCGLAINTPVGFHAKNVGVCKDFPPESIVFQLCFPTANFPEVGRSI